MLLWLLEEEKEELAERMTMPMQEKELYIEKEELKNLLLKRKN